MVGYYYGTLAYVGFGSQLEDGEVHSDGIMSVLSDEFLTRAVFHRSKVETPDGERDVGIIPAKFNTMRVIKDPTRLPS